MFSSVCDKFAVKTYKMNCGEVPTGDITQIPTEDISKHNILLAGFPCQAFLLENIKQLSGHDKGRRLKTI
ncbi:DNA cytosine methyltransferase [Oceanobacillus sp. CF4.6]|uniref:DNA cytosine methyltransferase n=1 Tax=Oceanobacillus sp. CF4.6 TaxID=3373080 RepID=UPI003EE736A1